MASNIQICGDIRHTWRLMRIAGLLTDEAVLRELGSRLARMRLERNLKQTELAAKAGVAKRTLERIEAGGSAQLVNLVRVCRALGMLENFEALIPPPQISPVELMKLHGRQRKRAATAKPPASEGKWKWGDER